MYIARAAAGAEGKESGLDAIRRCADLMHADGSIGCRPSRRPVGPDVNSPSWSVTRDKKP